MWSEHLQKVVDIYNGLYHSSIQMSPNFLESGGVMEDQTPEDSRLRNTLKNTNLPTIPISKESLWESARNNNQKAAALFSKLVLVYLFGITNISEKRMNLYILGRQPS